MDLQARVNVLERELEDANFKIQELEKEFADTDWLPDPTLGLTGKEARLAQLLLKRNFATKEQILAYLYFDPDDRPDPKIVDVFVCKLRAKLSPFDIEIETHWGTGYAMNPTSTEALKAMDARKYYVENIEDLK